MKQVSLFRRLRTWASFLPQLLAALWLGLLPSHQAQAQATTTIKLEAESATLTGVNVATTITGYSGTGYVWDFDNATDNVLFTFQATAGQYDIVIQYTSPYGDKGYDLAVNGATTSKTFSGPVAGFSATTAGRYTLLAGQNTVQISNGWGYYGIDYIALVPVSTAPAPVVPVVNGRLEAELGVLNGVTVATTPPGFSGTGVVTGFDSGTDNVSLTFNATAGLYKVGIGYNAPNGDKGYDLKVNDESTTGMLTGNGSNYGEVNAGSFLLKAGLNTIVINNGWGYYNVDYLQLTPTSVALPAAVLPTLADPLATTDTKALFAYLRGQFGKKVLAGQHASPQDTLADIRYIIQKTGKEPALASFDLIEYSPSRVAHGSNPKGFAEQYLAWAAKDQGRGIVSLMWHWNAPTDLIDSATEPWWKGFYTEGTTFDIAAVMADTTGSRYQLLKRDIDSIAVQLKKFQAANIPVLWRPLHEAPGAFFWWGAKGPEAYKALWHMLYKRLTNYHHLHNLIWVYSTTQSPPASWYPGDAYVDITGPDLYLDATANMSSDWNGFQTQFGGKKLVALTESGNLPDPDKVRAFATWWSWFNIWSGADYIRKQPLAYLQRVYTDADIITRDELPNWRSSVVTATTTATAATEGLVCYPNPASGSTLHASLTLATVQAADIVLTNTLGQQLAHVKTTLHAGTNTIELPIAHLSSGLYQLTVRAGNQPAYTKRVVIAH
ncbi:MAG: glycosyl hydrolase [Janthinobacterium lividum]